MKRFINIFILFIFIGFISCNQSSKNKKQSEQEAVVYTCPMHPEVTSDKAGECPKCGMALVKKDEHHHPDSSSNVDDEVN